MQKHITIVGILHIGLSIFGLLLGAGLYFLLITIGVMQDDYQSARILSIVANFIGIFFVAISLPGFAGGIGLLYHKEWSRILVMIVSAINLINIPIGTIVGGYSLWVLVQDETQQLFSKTY